MKTEWHSALYKNKIQKYPYLPITKKNKCVNKLMYQYSMMTGNVFLYKLPSSYSSVTLITYLCYPHHQNMGNGQIYPMTDEIYTQVVVDIIKSITYYQIKVLNALYIFLFFLPRPILLIQYIYSCPPFVMRVIQCYPHPSAHIDDVHVMQCKGFRT